MDSKANLFQMYRIPHLDESTMRVLLIKLYRLFLFPLVLPFLKAMFLSSIFNLELIHYKSKDYEFEVGY